MYHDGNDEDNDDDDEDVVEEDDVQFNKYFLLIVSRGGSLFLSPRPTGGYPLRLIFLDLHKQLVRKMTTFGPSLSLSLSFSLSLS